MESPTDFCFGKIKLLAQRNTCDVYSNVTWNEKQLPRQIIIPLRYMYVKFFTKYFEVIFQSFKEAFVYSSKNINYVRGVAPKFQMTSYVIKYVWSNLCHTCIYMLVTYKNNIKYWL